jgi:hypothetical protein
MISTFTMYSLMDLSPFSCSWSVASWSILVEIRDLQPSGRRFATTRLTGRKALSRFHSSSSSRRIKSMTRLSVLIGGFLLTLGVVRADWQQVQSVEPGTPILVKSGFVSDAGKFVRSTPDSVLIDTRAGQVTVAKDDIDEVLVFRSRPNRVRSGLLWGGVAAGVTAAAMFPMFAGLSSPNYVVPSTMTAANGASFGLGGYMRGKTKRIYRRTR